MSARPIAIVTGGSGYIGGFLIRRLLASGNFGAVLNFDLVPSEFGGADVDFRRVDVRTPIDESVGTFDRERSWIFNLAALAREPGSPRTAYFDTNVGGAEHVTAWARRIGIRNVYFTSSMSSMGRMELPTGEDAHQYPETAYGISKLVAEKIHLAWLASDDRHRLITCRPAVIFGPGDRENMARLITAVKRGYFAFPGDPSIVKAYGYVEGLIDSIAFVMRRQDRLITYHYAERDCLPLRGVIETMGELLGKRPRVVRLPQAPLVAAAAMVGAAGRTVGRKPAIDPVRVRKVAFPTNLKPQYLIDRGFEFRYPLDRALAEWRRRDPELFA